MNDFNPMRKSKMEFKETIDKIASNTAVGIDPQLTHAIIIDYLQHLTQRLENIEKLIVQYR